VARRARGFGLRIEAIDVVRPDDRTMAELQPDFFGTPEDLDAVLARCDFVTVHLHLTDATRHILDARRLVLMKPTACVINVARGPLIEEAALYRALLDGKLGGAALDVFAREPADLSQPALQLPNVIVTPHVSGQTNDTLRRRIAMMMENLRRFAEKREILYRVA
jgi:phosphoglycerate dehydrogenase-like enzyme